MQTVPLSVRILLSLVGILAFAVGFLQLAKDANRVLHAKPVKVTIVCNDAVDLVATAASFASGPITICDARYTYAGAPYVTEVPAGRAMESATFHAFVAPAKPEAPFTIDVRSVGVYSVLSAFGAGLIYACVWPMRRRPKLLQMVPARPAPAAEARWGIRPEEPAARSVGPPEESLTASGSHFRE